MTTTITRIATAAIVLLMAVPWAPAADAKFVEPKMSFSEAQPHQRRSFEAFTESNPTSPFVYPGYEECVDDSVEYCHVVQIEWRPDKANGHETFFWIGWTEGECCMYATLYNDLGHIRGQTAGENNPSQVEAPGGGGIPDLEPGTYHLAITNDGTQSAYYVELSADFVEITLPEGAQGATPRPRPTPIAQAATPRPRATSAPTLPPDPTPTPELIAMPGEDGPTSDRNLPVVAAGSQAAPLEQEQSLWATLLTILLVLAVAGGGTAFVVMRIRRDIRLGP